jgi:cell division protein FtsL
VDAVERREIMFARLLRTRKNKIRKLTPEELADIQNQWEMSSEYKRLHYRQATLEEEILVKSGAYSKRC